MYWSYELFCATQVGMVACALIAAALWAATALVKIPDTDEVKVLTSALKKQGKLNTWAAIFTGIAGILQLVLVIEPGYIA